MPEFIRDLGGLRDWRENDTLNRVEDVQEQSRVDWCTKVKCKSHGLAEGDTPARFEMSPEKAHGQLICQRA